MPSGSTTLRWPARESGVPTETGRFAADMKVRLLNDGPVTFWLRVAAGWALGCAGDGTCRRFGDPCRCPQRVPGARRVACRMTLR